MAFEKQTSEAQKGEIEFRKMLVQQESDVSLPRIEGTLTIEQHEALMAQRMDETSAHVGCLVKKGIAISPYIELGAERCQRSLVLENDLQATGIATDLSYHALRSAAHYAKIFDRPRMPLRLCGDAYHLPILSNSVAFAFTYATLHHFPDPTVIVAEIHRILAPGGTFYFSEEPFKCELHVDLYTAKHVHTDRVRRRGRLSRVLERHFGRHSPIEGDYSIVENDQISVPRWKRILAVFAERNVTLCSAHLIESSLDWRATPVKYAISRMCGGTIGGFCRKAGQLPDHFEAISEILACPACLASGVESRLAATQALMVCDRCRCEFSVADGVVIALPTEKLESLYPELSHTASNGRRNTI